MSKSLWSIVVLGFITIILMVIMMLFSLSVFQGSPAFNRVKFSNLVRERFNFSEVGAEVKDVGGQLLLRVQFLSSVDSNFNDEVINEELERVADFARRSYDGKDRRMIGELRVKRVEVQGSGCWTRTLERELTVEKPFAPPAKPTEDPEDE